MLQGQTEIPPRVLEAYRECEQLLAPLRSPLLAVAADMDEHARRHAFHAAYLWLRVLPAECLPRPIGRARSAGTAAAAVREWRDRARLCHQGQPDPDDVPQIALADAMARFSIPMAPWLALEKGLLNLLHREPLADVTEFLRRARRLAQAPASVFFRIICAKPRHQRYELDRELDMERLVHDPAAFAYVVGAMADVFRDVERTRPARSGLPTYLLFRHGMSVERLLEVRPLPHAPRDFENLMEDLSLLAWNFYESGVARLSQSAAHFPPEAVRHLDGLLNHYKAALRDLQRHRYAPVEFERVAAALEPRAVPGRAAAGRPAPR